MITLKITTPSGTTLSLNIPETLEESKNKASKTAPAVVTPEPTHVWVEDLSTEQQKAVRDFVHDPAIEKALGEFKAKLESEKALEGEEKEEDGRIGGVGERKEEGDEEGKPNVFDPAKPKVVTRNGEYPITGRAMTLWKNIYGEEWTIAQLGQLQDWINQNIDESPSIKQTGRFIKKWLSDKSGATKRKYIKRATLGRDYSRNDASLDGRNGLLNSLGEEGVQDGW